MEKQVNKYIGRFIIISKDLGPAKLLRVDQKRDQSFTKTKSAGTSKMPQLISLTT